MGSKRAHEESTYEDVMEYYGKVLKTSKDLKTSACTASKRPHPEIIKLMHQVPDEVMSKFYGCGAPLPMGITGRRVLDLGCGSGRDCYVSAALVGPKGKVVGIDMTDEQLSVAKNHAPSYCSKLGHEEGNLSFIKGHIEFLDKAGLKDASFDIVISNCVVNLSPDKPRVLQEVFRVLAPGGEFYFSDVYADRRLSAEAKAHKVLWGECIAGAMYEEDFIREAQKAGFDDPRVLAKEEIIIHDPVLKDVVGRTRFYSITYRLFKLPGMLETKCEDYGQYAVYKGTIPGLKHHYDLDDHHTLETNKPFLVCGNTAAMLGENGVCWLAPHFEIHGNRDVHYGLFDCGGGPACAPVAAAGGACC